MIYSSKVIEFPRMDQPSSYWLCREHVKGDIDDNNDDDCDDIMAPVLGPTDSTQWLVQKADSKVQDERSECWTFKTHFLLLCWI